MPEPAARPPVPHHIGSVAALVLLGFFTLVSHGFGLSLLPAMLPRVADAFGAGYDELGAVVAVGLISYAVGALTAAWVLDAFPARFVLVATFVVQGAGFLAAAGAPATPWLTGAAVMLGAAAPVCWAATLAVAREAVDPAATSVVMAGAAGGAAVGVIANGVLVLTSETLHSWRVSFLVAGLAAGVAIAAALQTLPAGAPAGRRAGSQAGSGRYRTILTTPAGQAVVVSGLVAGAAGFPFSAFLTATAIDEFMVGAGAAGALWWLIGVGGGVAGPTFGRLGTRTGPTTALAVGFTAYAAGMALLSVVWGYPALAVASVLFSAMNYPLWGLVGVLAASQFTPDVANRAISLGLVAASGAGAIGNAATGAWIESTGSFRVPSIVAAGLATVTAAWLWSLRTGRQAATAPPAPGL